MKFLPFLFGVGLLAATVHSQEPNALLPLVRRLDAQRLPPGDFVAQVRIEKSKPGAASAERSVFQMNARRRTEADGHILVDTLLICREPAKDAGKKILVLGGDCWFHDPPAKRATRIPAQQIAAQTAVADLLNWRFADDFDHRSAGRETLTVAGKVHECAVLDLTPKPGLKNRPALMRLWLDDNARAWRTDYFTPSRKLLRTVLFTAYGDLLGVGRPARFTISSAGQNEDIAILNAQPSHLPASCFEPENLPQLALPPLNP